jgi:hypothetical protein
MIFFEGGGVKSGGSIQELRLRKINWCDQLVGGGEYNKETKKEFLGKFYVLCMSFNTIKFNTV